MKINIVTMATGRYTHFLPQFVQSAKRFIPQLDSVYVLSDSAPMLGLEVEWLPWGHFGWPLSTFMRYIAINSYRVGSSLFEADIVLYSDVDMRVVGEFTLPKFRGLLAVEHPGYFDSPRALFPYESDSRNPFFIPPNSGKRYFAGGVQGGTSTDFANAVQQMAILTRVAVLENQIPIWHDESVWNKFLTEVEPTLILSRDFCTPEHEQTVNSKILALNKDHAFFRDFPVKKKSFFRGRG